MSNLSLLFLSGVLACTGAYKSITIEKPSPCYTVKDVRREGERVDVILARPRGVLCPQVIARESIRVERDVEKVRVIIDNRVWKEYRISEGKEDEH